MLIKGKPLANKILAQLKKDVRKLKTKPKLVVFTITPSPEDMSFIKIKEKSAKYAGVHFELIHYKKIPRYEEFVNHLKKVATDPSVTGLIIQRPLPDQISSMSMYNFIPDHKEIEAFKNKSYYLPPIGMAVLTVIKNAYINDKNPVFDIKNDYIKIKNIFKKKNVVIIGRGQTGGAPIADTFRRLKINFISIHSKTPDPEKFLNIADFVISAVGKKVVNPAHLKKGVFLISVGIRKEKGKWLGDYHENEIKKIASFYTPTPGGIGPIDVSYLIYNLVNKVE